jgi:DNA-binding transcriptional regulator YdaS (Cro superfamily)
MIGMNEITAQERKAIADKFGMNEQYLYQCLTGRRDMDHAKAMRMEKETGGVLTRKMLCQESYAEVWPELAPKRKVR